MKRLIRRLLNDGYNSGEVSALSGIATRRVHRLARRWGVGLPLGLGDNARAITVVVPKTIIAKIDQLSAESGLSRSKVLSRIVVAQLDGSNRHLLRYLISKRDYARRGAGR